MRQRLSWPHVLWAVALVAVGLLTSTVWAAAITGKIVGSVRDQAGNPLPGTSVFIEGRQLGATTDADGRYFVLQVPPGTYTVEARLVGYQAVRQQNVVVHVDRTTELSFTLRESAIEVEPITVTAVRPVVETDVTSSQVFITTEQAQDIPVNTLIDALAIQAGISIVNRTAISVRGSTPDEISFQVDGFEQTNALEQRSYTAINQAMVQEVQLLTGAFTAEYSARAAVVNVVTKDPGSIPTASLDGRTIPARHQHFGPDAFAGDQFDRLLYMGDGTKSTNGRMFNATFKYDSLLKKNVAVAWTDRVNSNLPVYIANMAMDIGEEYDIRFQYPPEFPGDASPLFMGWNALAAEANSKVSTNPLLAAHKGFWTVDGLRKAWAWEHRGWDYANQSDYFVDAALTMPLYGVPRTGLVLGFKDVRTQLPFPTVTQAYTDRVFEGTFKSSIIPSVKLEARGRYEVINTTIGGMHGAGGLAGTRDVDIFASGDQSAIVAGTVSGGGATLLGSVQAGLAGAGAEVNKYNILGNVPYEETVQGGGLRLTHTLSPSTYYNVSYEFLSGKVVAHPSRRRILLDYAKDPALKLSSDSTVAYQFDMNGRIVQMDETPEGFLGGEAAGKDIVNRYNLQGGGFLSDYSEWSSTRLRADAFSQINSNHALKLGAEYVFQHLIKDLRRINRLTGMNAHFDRYDHSPWQMGFYLQDKMEYEGFIATYGVRLDGYQADGIILFPDKKYPDEFVRGQLVQVLRDLGIEPNDYAQDELTYIDSSRNVDKRYELYQAAMSVLPSAQSKTYWRFAPRMGVSHPIGVSTKFFFNFGWMYSAPKAGFRYGYEAENAQFGTSGSEIRGTPNPNLVPPRSTVYEVGFEQSLQNVYVVRVRGYSKDDEDEPGFVNRIGLGSSVISGGPGRKSVKYGTFENTQYQTYRGLEVTVEKARGRFVTGSFNFDFRVITVGQSGFNEEFEDSKATTTFAPVVINQPQFQPTSRLTITLRTPNDWGIAAGNWSLSLLQNYARGTKSVYYYDGDQTNPKVLRWVDTWRTNARLQKSISFAGARSITAYMDVRNVFNQKRFNPGAIIDGRIYYQNMLMAPDKEGTPQAKYKIGDDRFNSEIERRLVRDNDWLVYLDPRELQFGVRIDL